MPLDTLVERREVVAEAEGTFGLLLIFLGPLLRTRGAAISQGLTDVTGGARAGAGAGALVDGRSTAAKVRKRSFRASRDDGGAVGGPVVGRWADEAEGATEFVLDGGRTEFAGDLPTETNLNRAERLGSLELRGWTGEVGGKAMLDGVEGKVAGGRAACDDRPSGSAAA